MSRREMLNNIYFVVFGENSGRLARLEQLPDGKWSIVIDVHGLTVQEAKKMLKNLINILRIGVQIVVIHGYHGGTAIRDMIRTDDFGYRLQSISSPLANPGVSVLQVAAMRGCAAC